MTKSDTKSKSGNSSDTKAENQNELTAQDFSRVLSVLGEHGPSLNELKEGRVIVIKASTSPEGHPYIVTQDFPVPAPGTNPAWDSFLANNNEHCSKWELRHVRNDSLFERE